MTVTTCARCGCTRDQFLLGALPCEQCGAAPDEIEDVELPPDDSWSGDLGRDRYEDQCKT